MEVKEEDRCSTKIGYKIEELIEILVFNMGLCGETKNLMAERRRTKHLNDSPYNAKETTLQGLLITKETSLPRLLIAKETSLQRLFIIG